MQNLSDDTTGSSGNDSQSLDVDLARVGSPAHDTHDGMVFYLPAEAAAKSQSLPAKKKSSKAMALAKGIKRKVSS